MPRGMGGPGGPGGPRNFLTDEEKQNKPKVTRKLLLRIFSYLKPYALQLILSLVLIIASSSMKLLPSILTGKIIDDGLYGRNLSLLIKLIILLLATRLFAELIGVLESYLNTWIAQHISYDMRNQMYSHLQKMSQKFFTNNSQGEIITRMTSDISGVERVISSTFSSILSNSITLVIAIIAMLQRSLVLTIVGILVIPLFVIPTRAAGKTRWEITKKSQEANDQMNGILNETMSVSGQLLVKLFCKEEYEYNRYQQLNKQMIDLNIKESMSGRWFRVIISTLSNFGPMLLYLVGGILIIVYDHDLTVGDITIMVSLLNQMYGPVNSLLNIQTEWIRAMAMFTRIFEYYDLPVDIQNSIKILTPKQNNGEVEFKHVYFSYDQSKEILKDINFKVEAGKSIAIVGPSGSGKSTTINLIPRLYDVRNGEVTFNGINVKNLDLQYLRNNVAIVSQDTYLFNGTIRENLLYAKSDATEDELIQALKDANIYDFVQNQSTGLDTMVGNRGLKLSGGEKQRISIARALLRNPSLLIFDEATSALDSISESKIQEAITPLIKKRTSILIAHRLSTILSADKIIVIKEGRIVEEGTHDELMDINGVYKELYDTQFSKAFEMESKQ